MSNTSFHFRHTFLLSAHFSPSHVISCSSLMSHHQVNNKCNNSNNNSKRMGLRFLIYALCNFLLHNNMLRFFKSNHHCPQKFHKFHRKTAVLESLFLLKAFVPYFLSNSHFFSLNDSPLKTMKNVFYFI